MFNDIFLGGFSIYCGAAFLLWALVIVFGFISKKSQSALFPILIGAGSLTLAAGAAFGGNGSFSLPLPLFLGGAGFQFLVDPLSRIFLAIIGLVGIAAALFSPGYLHHLRGRVSIGFFWAVFSALLVSMAAVVISANAIVFLFAWEIMAISSFALVASDNESHSVRKAAVTYLVATRAGTAFLMAGFLWAYKLTGSWTFSDWRISGAAAIGPALLIFIGLATKAGCWPFHLWLPIAHPAAPSPVSAVMSGVMLKTAIYAMIRLLVMNLIDFPALGAIFLIIGGISAFWGVLFALLQHDLKRLLAYHSVENIGIILMGLGIAVIGKQINNPLVAQLGLAGAVFHSFNHAMFKSLLFFGTGVVDARTHTREIEKLGGLIKFMPFTTACFIIGSAAICALPPLNGFASEWLVYCGLFTIAKSAPSVIVRFGGVLMMGWLAMVGAMALACFVKAVSVVFLGAPRSSEAERAKEGTRGMVAGQILLALVCVSAGLLAPQILKKINAILAAFSLSAASQNLWTIPMPLFAVIFILTITIIYFWMNVISRKHPARKFITWECGFGKTSPRSQYTATSFVQPIARMFGAIYHYAVHVELTGKDRRHFPEKISAESDYEPYLQTKFYSPLLRLMRKISGLFLGRLQTGSIHQYLLNMVLVLMLLLWVVFRK